MMEVRSVSALSTAASPRNFVFPISVSANRFVILRQEPVEQRAMFGEFPANDGSPQRERIVHRRLAEKLRLSVEILGVGVIFFAVPSTLATEYAVGTEVNEASAPRGSHLGELVGQERIDCDTGNRRNGFRPLLDDGDPTERG